VCVSECACVCVCVTDNIILHIVEMMSQNITRLLKIVQETINHLMEF
jgi:hypothetical protein